MTENAGFVFNFVEGNGIFSVEKNEMVSADQTPCAEKTKKTEEKTIKNWRA